MHKTHSKRIFPEIFKLSKVTAIDKGRDEWILLIINASLHSLHKLKFSINICKQLLNYLEKHEILYEFQLGFRKGHSTSQTITEIADNFVMR